MAVAMAPCEGRASLFMSDVGLRPNFGEWLQRMRERRGLTVIALADKSGISKASISQYESGGRFPLRASVAALAVALDLPVEDAMEAAGFVSSSEEGNTGQTVVLKPGVVAHLYSPSGEAIEVTPRLLKILTAYAEPDTEELVGASGEQGKSESGEI